jgi:hypothetical protein
MFKMLVGFFVGIVLTGALFLGPLESSATVAEDGMEPVSGNTTEELDLSGLDVKQMLYTAGENILTEETQRYYETLLGEYDIDELPAPTEELLNSNPLAMLPDMGRVNNTAIMMPLEQAGKQIKDGEIAAFYYKLLRDAGWSITP